MPKWHDWAIPTNSVTLWVLSVHPSETSELYRALQKPRRRTSSYEQPPFRPENLRQFLCFCIILRTPMHRTFCDTNSSLDRGSATLQCNFAMAAALCEVTASRLWVKWLFFHVFLFFENIYPIKIRLEIPLILIICYSSAVSGGVEHLLLPWNAGFILWRMRECLVLDDVTLE